MPSQPPARLARRERDTLVVWAHLGGVGSRMCKHSQPGLASHLTPHADRPDFQPGRWLTTAAIEEVIERELPHLAIVDPATWNAVAKLNEARANASCSEGGMASARRVYPLSSLLRCNLCGSSMVIQNSKRPRYVCDASRGNGGACRNKRTVMEPELRMAVFTTLGSYFRRPEVHEFVRKEIERELTRLKGARGPAMAEVVKRRRSLTEAQGRFLEAIRAGDAPACVLAELHKIEQDLARLDEEEQRLSAQSTCPTVPSRDELIEMVSSLEKLSDDDPGAVREALKQLLGPNGIQMHPTPEGGMSRAGACVLGNYCSKNKRPRVKPRGARSDQR